jgi:molybdopterin molybdotransferase
VGLVLAEPVIALTAMPPFAVAACDGYAVRGPGPWTVEGWPDGLLPDGAATRVQLDAALPAATDSVLALGSSVVRTGKEVTWLYVGDAASGRQAERPGHLHPGTGVRITGELAAEGQRLVPQGAVVGPAVVSAAAAAGHDALTVVRPPDVVPVTLGDARWERGHPREGRLRDAISPALPGALSRAGARCLPPVLVRGRPGTLADKAREVVDDVAADLVVLTGHPGAAGRADAAGALSALGANVLVADVEVRPGADLLLVELPDGRLAAYVPGDATGAAAALVTVVLPVLRAMAGRPEPEPVLALLDSAHRGSESATSLVPAIRERGELADTARLGHGGDVLDLALAGSFAVVPPGGAAAGTLVELVELP